jgi:uncharacterized coiled-coil DUF342 family protein
MIDAIYAIIIVAFAFLGVWTLFNHLIRGNEFREAIVELREQTEQVETRIATVRSEVDDLKFESDTMDDERVALEKQTRCMLDLEESFKVAQVAALEGDKSKKRKTQS